MRRVVDPIGCAVFGLLAVGVFFILADIARAIVWIKWALQ